jgi:hypothetical protein
MDDGRFLVTDAIPAASVVQTDANHPGIVPKTFDPQDGSRR